MKYLDAYRDPALARRLLDELRRTASTPWRIMEVCGGPTHTLVRQGIDELPPAGIRMIHGPGCPVCVTPLETLDRAMAIVGRPGTILTSFGDMLRVPGTDTDLLSLRARGADVRVVYTPMDAVRIAADRRSARSSSSPSGSRRPHRPTPWRCCTPHAIPSRRTTGGTHRRGLPSGAGRPGHPAHAGRSPARGGHAPGRAASAHLLRRQKHRGPGQACARPV